MKRFRGGLVSKAHGLLHHSTLGSRVVKKKKNSTVSQHHDTFSQHFSAIRQHFNTISQHSRFRA